MPAETKPFAEALDDWFARLDDAKFRVGVRERLLVHTLLARVAASDDAKDSRTLAGAIDLARPLLCADPVQQQRYAVLARQFLQERGASP